MKPISRAPRPRPRGLRRPQHHGMLEDVRFQRVQPWMAAPLRPGETIRKIDLQGESWFNHAIQARSAPLMYTEIGIWKVPMSALGQAFVDLVVASAEDARDLGGVTTSVLSGSGVVFKQGGASNAGHLSPGLQNRNRPWAGEIGPTDLSSSEASYMPYTSFATWAVANTWYEIEWDDSVPGHRMDEDLFQTEPRVGDYIRGATHTGITQSLGSDDDPGGYTSLSQMVEALSLLTKTSRTYAEYLAGFGIDPKRVSSIPQPLMVQQKLLRPSGTGTLVHDFISDLSGQETFGTDPNLSTYSKSFDGTAGPGLGVVSDQEPVVMHQATWNATADRDFFVTEPSILLGTVCNWSILAKELEFAHHMDMNRMVSGAHWGDPSYGGIDESEFLTAQILYKHDGTGAITADEDGEGGIRAFNMLNLFVNGDTFTNKPDSFNFRAPLGGTSNDEFTTHKLSCRVDIASDMMGG